MCEFMSRRGFILGAGAVTAAAGLPGCTTTNPATGRESFTGFYSIDDDIKIGSQEHPKMTEAFGGVYENPRVQSYVEGLGNRLAQFAEVPQFRYRFTVLNSPIVNAFALPGGYVYVSRGLLALASSEAELAGVMAHEIGHVTARHTAERLSAAQMAQIGVLGLAVLGLGQQATQLGQTVASLAIAGYSRNQESEADRLGVRYMSAAGYDPDAMVTFLSTLREHSQIEAKMKGLPPGKVDEYNVMATHPRTADRVREATQAAAAARPADPRIGRDDYLNTIDGMLFGDDPSQGMVRGQRFVHPKLRFEFTAPEGFLIRNALDRVTAQHPNGGALVFDMGRAARGRPMAQYLQNDWARDIVLREVETLNVNGMEAATGTVRGNTDAGQVDLRGLAIRGDGEAVYRFLFLSPARATASLAEGFRRTTYSFRRLTAEEAAAINPLRLLVVRPLAGDTVDALSRTLPFGQYSDEWFRVLNDLQPGQPIQPDRRIKVVAA